MKALFPLCIFLLLAGCSAGSVEPSEPPAAGRAVKPGWSFTPNYSDGNLYHWPNLPVRVAFLNGPVYSGLDLRKEAVRALDAWQKALSGKVPYRIVPASGAFDVLVRFEKIPAPRNTGFLVAKTDLQNRGYFNTRAEIAIYYWDGMAAGSLNPGIYNAMVHEYGHSLGVKQHSPEPADVMYTFISGAPKPLTIRDINTMKRHYASLF